MTTAPLPFATAAPLYRAAGWAGTIPLTPGSKGTSAGVPVGFTGGRDDALGHFPSDADVAAWTTIRPADNIALRLPDGVIGYDVDSYKPEGAASFAAHLAARGQLPATYRSSARDDESGVRLFRVPAGHAWPSHDGPGIDVIAHTYRYAVVAPSIHPSLGTPYRWTGPSGEAVDVPDLAQVPDLPAAWLDTLSKGLRGAQLAARDVNVETFLRALPNVDPGPYVGALLQTYRDAIRADEGHPAMRTFTMALANAGAEGAPGVPAAWAEARALYGTVKGAGHDGVDAFDRAFAGAIAKIDAPNPLVFVDPPSAVTGTASAAVSSDSPAASRSSWASRDITMYFEGNYNPPRGTMMPRADGIHLVYPGLTHSFHGESESGKSMLLQFETVRLLTAGRPVLFVDFESDPASVVGRLRAFGTSREALSHLTYVRPDEGLGTPEAGAAWEEVLSHRYELAVVDGVTDALTLLGGATKDNDDVAKWMRTIPRKIADRTGAGVAVIDHVTKSTDGRGRFAIGGQAKMSSLTGAAYTVEVAEALAPGRLGVISVRVGKDRPGGVREHAGPFRKSDRTQEIVRVVVDSRDKSHPPIVTWEVPTAATDETVPPDLAAERQAEKLREKISRAVENAGAEGLSGRAIVGSVGGNRDTVNAAAAWLVDHHHLVVRPSANRSQLHTSFVAYRAPEIDEEPLDFLSGGDPGVPAAAGSTDLFPAA